MKKRILFLFMLVLLIAGITRADSLLGFDSSLGYDIYFGSGEQESTVVREVDIVGFKDIGQKTFVVVKIHEFKLKDVEGYILLDSVRAILPHGHFRVQ